MQRNLVRTMVLCLLPAVLMAAGGCASDKAIISQAQQFHGGIEKAVITDPVLDGYLNEVGKRIIDQAREMSRADKGPKAHREGDNAWMFGSDMKFHLVNSKTINAFTTGGNHMYIYTALFDLCKTEDELAAVMAHEFAHVYARHVHNGMNRQYGSLAIAAVAGLAGYAVGGDDREAVALGRPEWP